MMNHRDPFLFLDISTTQVKFSFEELSPRNAQGLRTIYLFYFLNHLEKKIHLVLRLKERKEWVKKVK